MYKSIILPLAKQDIKEASTWYNERQSGLGKRFRAHVRKTVHYICQNPKTVAVRYDNTRTILLDIFPYLIHFSIDEEKKLIIIAAVLNTSRDPKMWTEKS